MVANLRKLKWTTINGSMSNKYCNITYNASFLFNKLDGEEGLPLGDSGSSSKVWD